MEKTDEALRTVRLDVKHLDAAELSGTLAELTGNDSDPEAVRLVAERPLADKRGAKILGSHLFRLAEINHATASAGYERLPEGSFGPPVRVDVGLEITG